MHDLECLTLMSQAIESFHVLNPAGFTDIDILWNLMALGPGQLDGEHHLSIATLGELHYQMGSSHRMTFQYISDCVCEFTELATHLGFMQGVFTLNPELDLETVLLREGWTKPCQFHNMWYFYQERLHAFMNHYQHMRSTLSRYQCQEECLSNLEQSLSVAPTTFTDPLEVHQAYRRRMDRMGDAVPLEEPEEELPELPAFPRWTNLAQDPPLRPRTSVHVAAQGPTENWRTPRQPEPSAPPRVGECVETWNSLHCSQPQLENWRDTRSPFHPEFRDLPPHMD